MSHSILSQSILSRSTLFRAGRAAFVCALLLLGAIGAAPAARAGSSGDEAAPGPADLALEGLDRLMQALGLFINSIPQYEAPTITEEGDIIIRRKRDDGAAPPPFEDAPPDETGPVRI